MGDVKTVKLTYVTGKTEDYIMPNEKVERLVKSIEAEEVWFWDDKELINLHNLQHYTVVCDSAKIPAIS